jgi:thiol-disulfide isomerase/thioredoxin
MRKVIAIAVLMFFTSANAQSDQLGKNHWRIALIRKDSVEVPFMMERNEENGRIVLYVINAAERIRIPDVRLVGDSMFFSLPTFESSFKLRILGNGNLSGTYIKGTSGATQYWKLFGLANVEGRFDPVNGDAKSNISGRWDMTFIRPNGTTRKALGIFAQKGNSISGSVLTPSADNRYLSGRVSGDSLLLSGFDGDNIHLYTAEIYNSDSISGGTFYNGYTRKEKWIAERNNNASLPEALDPTRLRPGQTRLNFTFNDLEGKPVSINDKRFRGKVVIVQIMGSWCANCFDETKFLADYYRKNHSKGIEIIALAYELTTNIGRSKISLLKFKKLLNVEYPILITGVAAGDDKKTEKTLPQLTPIHSFPITIFIDKKGFVKDIHTNFYGPASGPYFIESKEEFYKTVDKLMNE